MHDKASKLLIFLIFQIMFLKEVFSYDIAVEMDKIKNYVDKIIPDIETLDDYHKVIALRNFVYQHTSIGSLGRIVFPWTFENFNDITDKKESLLCYGISVEYIALLSLYGFQAREVDLSANNGNFFDTHVLVEVYVDNNWILEDPTFNVDWSLDEIKFGSLSLAEHYANKKTTPIMSSEGYSILTGRNFNENSLPIKELLHSVEISVINPWLNQYLFPSVTISRNIFFDNERIKEDNVKKVIFSDNFDKDFLLKWFVDDFSVVILNNEGQVSFETRVIVIQDFLKEGRYIMQSPFYYCQKGDYELRLKGKIEAGLFDVELQDRHGRRISSLCKLNNFKKNGMYLCKYAIKKPMPCSVVFSAPSSIARSIYSMLISKISLIQY